MGGVWGWSGLLTSLWLGKCVRLAPPLTVPLTRVG